MVLLIVRSAGKQSHIVDNFMRSKFVKSAKATFDNLGTEGVANHRNSLSCEWETKGQRDSH